MIKKNKGKLIIFVILIPLVFLFGYVIFGSSSTTVYKVVNADKRETKINNDIRAMGQFEYKEAIDHFTPFSGIVKDVRTKNGESINTGETIAVIEVDMGSEIYHKHIKSLEKGEILTLNVKKGDFIDTGELVASIGDPKRIDIVGEISEFDYYNVHVGNEVEIESNAFEGIFNGKVTEINSAAQSNQENDGAVIGIRADINLKDRKINPIPGLNVFLNIKSDDAESEVSEISYLVPSAAILEEEEEDRYYVYIYDEVAERIEKKEVILQDKVNIESNRKEIGNKQFSISVEKKLTDEEIMDHLIEVESGITESELIIADPPIDLNESDQIDKNSIKHIQTD